MAKDTIKDRLTVFWRPSGEPAVYIFDEVAEAEKQEAVRQAKLEVACEIERLTRELAEAREAFDKLHAKWSNQRVTLQTIFGNGAGEPKP